MAKINENACRSGSQFELLANSRKRAARKWCMHMLLVGSQWRSGWRLPKEPQQITVNNMANARIEAVWKGNVTRRKIDETARTFPLSPTAEWVVSGRKVGGRLWMFITRPSHHSLVVVCRALAANWLCCLADSVEFPFLSVCYDICMNVCMCTAVQLFSEKSFRPFVWRPFLCVVYPCCWALLLWLAKWMACHLDITQFVPAVSPFFFCHFSPLSPNCLVYF